MSVGVLDVGCFSAHLVVVERDLMRPLMSHKVRLRLDRALDAEGAISKDGIESLCAAVLAARKKAGDVPFLPFATSSVRDSLNVDEVMRKVHRRTGVELKVLSGKEEARLSYTAARHWFGWSAGPMVVLDVGGGTVELALGSGSDPELAISLPLGARTLTRAGLTVQDMRAEVLDQITEAFPAKYRDSDESARAVVLRISGVSLDRTSMLSSSRSSGAGGGPAGTGLHHQTGSFSRAVPGTPRSAIAAETTPLAGADDSSPQPTCSHGATGLIGRLSTSQVTKPNGE